jgi:hypothetical protein
MRLTEAQAIIDTWSGYRVHFEVVDRGILRSNYVPDRDEEPFVSYDAAWAFAEKLARATRGKFVNFFVVRASDSTPCGAQRLGNR